MTGTYFYFTQQKTQKPTIPELTAHLFTTTTKSDWTPIFKSDTLSTCSFQLFHFMSQEWLLKETIAVITAVDQITRK